MESDYCNCHMKHVSSIADLKKDQENLEEDMGKKISLSWLFLLVPIFMTWISFQVIIYDSLKNLETKIAVIQQQLKE
jgi:hypothetical protein